MNLLRGYFQIGDQDEPRAIREKVTQKLLALDRALEPALPAILALLDAPVEDPGWETLSPPERRQRTINALKQLLLRESQVQPLLVVVEDLHWIDAETQAALDRLVESLPAARLLLLVNYRPEYRHDWSGKTYYHQLRLDPLPPEQASELLETLLGGDVGLAPLKPLLLARTEGNPFFLEEGVRSLVDDGVLLGDRGAYQLVKAPEAFDVPGTVQAILAARIDRLPADDRDLLQIASVVGTEVPVAVLAAVAGRAADALADGSPASRPPSSCTRQPGPGRGLHLQARPHPRGGLRQPAPRATTCPPRPDRGAIEALYPDRLAEHVERLAHHAVRGEAWEKAVAYLRQAGAKAFGRSANREAAARFEQALEALERLPETRARSEQGIDVRLQLRGALTALAEYRRLFDHLRRAQALAETLGDQQRLVRVSSYVSQCLKWVGDLEQALELAQRNVGMAEALGDRELQAMATMYLAGIHNARGEYRRAIELLRWTLDLLKDHPQYHFTGMMGGPFRLRLFAASGSRRASPSSGSLPKRPFTARKRSGSRRRPDQPYTHLALTCWGAGSVHLTQGDLPTAIAVLERARELCQAWQIPGMLPWAMQDLGAAYARSGRVIEGAGRSRGGPEPGGLSGCGDGRLSPPGLPG